ncbi:MAG TPA: hypothetical protein VFM93_11365 [Candidatus Limnocylindria bacterium]|nr:hypothetical protein [Candidatus Limnocylindria bacterium]
MPKRTRARARARRQEAPAYGRDELERPTQRQRAGRPIEPTRAVGEPSQALARAESWERGFVAKDFRRLVVTIAVMIALLIASGLVVTAVLG